MTKKKEKAVDYRTELTRKLERDFLTSRFEVMGEFQNKIVAVIDESSLPPQELYFMLQRIADGVMANFNRLLSSKETQTEK